MTLTGEQYEISAGPYRAVITEQGAGLRVLTHGGRPLILSYDADTPPPAAYGQILAPWPNRIAGGRYTYAGERQELAISEPATGGAIHGLVRWAGWRTADRYATSLRQEHTVLGQKGYPFRIDLAVTHTLDADTGLTVRIEAGNGGNRTAPYGHGSHPYLTVGQPIDGCLVTLPADRYLPVDEHAIPVGDPQPVEGTPLDLRTAGPLGPQRIDNAFTGLTRDPGGRAWTRLARADGSAATLLWQDAGHPWLEVYTADGVPADQRRHGLAAEPMTCPPDAFNSGVDLVELKPGETHVAEWGIRAE